MTHVLDAVYENGAFRPLDTPGPEIAEGQQVRIVVETEVPVRLLDLAGSVYDGLSSEDVRDIEAIALDRTRFFNSAG